MQIASTLGTTLLLTLLAGCSSGAPMPTPPPDPTATPVFASDEEALAAAEDAYGRYLEVSNDLGEGGWLDTSALDTVLRGEALDDELETSRDFSAKGYLQVGRSTFDNLRLQQWEGSDTVATLVVYLCLDVSTVDVVDGSGKSIVPPERVDRFPLEVSLDNGEGNFKVNRSEAWSGQSFC